MNRNESCKCRDKIYEINEKNAVITRPIWKQKSLHPNKFALETAQRLITPLNPRQPLLVFSKPSSEIINLQNTHFRMSSKKSVSSEFDTLVLFPFTNNRATIYGFGSSMLL